MNHALDIEALYREHGHMVFRRARYLLGGEEEARDVLQDVFMSLVHQPDQFTHKSSIVTWLYSATTHRCFNTLRNQRKRNTLLQAQQIDQEAATSRGSSEALVLARELFASMPETLAHVAIYYYLDEMTHEEIAQVVGCSRRHVGKLLEKVQRHLARQGGKS